MERSEAVRDKCLYKYLIRKRDGSASAPTGDGSEGDSEGSASEGHDEESGGEVAVSLAELRGSYISPPSESGAVAEDA